MAAAAIAASSALITPAWRAGCPCRTRLLRVGDIVLRHYEGTGLGIDHELLRRKRGAREWARCQERALEPDCPDRQVWLTRGLPVRRLRNWEVVDVSVPGVPSEQEGERCPRLEIASSRRPRQSDRLRSGHGRWTEGRRTTTSGPCPNNASGYGYGEERGERSC